jgi:hypothetical protein
MDVELHAMGQAVGQVRWFEEIEHVGVFSDTLIVFTIDDSLNSLSMICQFANSIFKVFLARKLPLRGAIAHGETILDIDQSLFLGQAIVDAHKLGESLDSLGIVLGS